MALARCGFQIHRVCHSKESNRRQRCCCWTGMGFVAQPDRLAERVRRRLRMCCERRIPMVMAPGAVCVFLLADLTVKRKSIAPLKSFQRQSKNSVVPQWQE